MTTFSGGYYFITHDVVDAEFNIASEQYLLEKGQKVIYVWRNKKAVIVGVGQNTLSEVDLTYTSDNDIQVVRRITGGGAVYHDLGNICFTVISDYTQKTDDVIVFTRPIVEFLKTLGVNAEFSGRNDILVDGRKISGMAQCVKGDKIMHHGTLLFSTDTSVLEKALIPSPLKLQAKGVKSVRKRVVNLNEYISNMDSDEFLGHLRNFLSKDIPTRSFTEEEISEINKIKKEKFSRYEWNIGKSPKGQFKKSARLSFGTMDLCFDIVDGRIRNVELYGDYFLDGDINELTNKLDGVKPVKQDILNALSGVDKIIRSSSAKEITEKLFFGE